MIRAPHAVLIRSILRTSAAQRKNGAGLPLTLKTGFGGTFHSFDFAKYAHRYLGEMQYRLNRRFDLRAMLPRLLAAAITTPPKPGHLLRMGLAEACR